MRVRKSATHDQSLVARNWPVGVLLLGALVCLVAGTASPVQLPDGNTVDLRGAGLMLGLVGLVLALYGIAVRNVGDTVAVEWLDAHLGKIFVALTVVWTVVSTILNVANSNLGRVDTPVLIGFMVGLLISWVITGLVMCLYWWLYGRFGFFRVSAVNYMLLVPLYLAGAALLSSVSSSTLATAGADRPTSLRDRPSGGMSSLDRAEQVPLPNSDLDPASLSLPTLPPLPPRSELAPGVQSDDTLVPGEIPPSLKERMAEVAGDVPLAPGSFGDRKKLPDLGDPDYHDRLVDCVLSDDPFLRRDALKSLDRVERADVESTDVVKRIAGAYKQLAFTDGSPDDRRAGIRGMAKWGGKYSVPLLLELLDQRSPFIRPDIYSALGKLADPRAGRPVAQRLGDFHDREEAYRCLQAMGPAAEDAVIEIAPSADAEISMAALRLLADIGTDKCLPILRKASRSRNRAIKEQAKVSTARVRERIAE